MTWAGLQEDINSENKVIWEPGPCYLIPPGIQDGIPISFVILELKQYVILEPVILKWKIFRAMLNVSC